MRWDELFADLEGQLEAGLDAEERDRQAEEERLRLGRLTLRDRLSALQQEPVRVRLLPGDVIELRPRTVGRDWIAGDLLPGTAQAVLPLAAVDALLLSPEQVARSAAGADGGALTDRLGVAFVLRDLARRRRRVEVRTDRGSVTGTLDGVGADHLQLAVHAADQFRRASDVVRIEVVPLSRVLVVRVD